MSLVEKLFGSFSDRELKKVNPITKQVLALEPKYQAMSDSDLQAQTAAFKQQLAEGKTLDDILPDAFAVCREAAWRAFDGEHLLANELTEAQKVRLMAAIDELKEIYDAGGCPCSVTAPDGTPVEYTIFRPRQYGDKYLIKEWPSCNAMLEGYYAEKDRA